MRSAILIGVAAFSMVAIASAQSDRVREHDPSWVAPERAALKPNPLASHRDLAAGGRKIFEQRCATCHGADARGTDRGPDLLASDVLAQTDGALFWKIGSGNTRTGMPSFSFLPEAQRWQIVLHLRALATDGR